MSSEASGFDDQGYVRMDDFPDVDPDRLGTIADLVHRELAADSGPTLSDASVDSLLHSAIQVSAETHEELLPASEPGALFSKEDGAAVHDSHSWLPSSGHDTGADSQADAHFGDPSAPDAVEFHSNDDTPLPEVVLPEEDLHPDPHPDGHSSFGDDGHSPDIAGH